MKFALQNSQSLGKAKLSAVKTALKSNNAANPKAGSGRKTQKVNSGSKPKKQGEGFKDTKNKISKKDTRDKRAYYKELLRRCRKRAEKCLKKALKSAKGYAWFATDVNKKDHLIHSFLNGIVSKPLAKKIFSAVSYFLPKNQGHIDSAFCTTIYVCDEAVQKTTYLCVEIHTNSKIYTIVSVVSKLNNALAEIGYDKDAIKEFLAQIHQMIKVIPPDRVLMSWEPIDWRKQKYSSFNINGTEEDVLEKVDLKPFAAMLGLSMMAMNLDRAIGGLKYKKHQKLMMLNFIVNDESLPVLQKLHKACFCYGGKGDVRSPKEIKVTYDTDIASDEMVNRVVLLNCMDNSLSVANANAFKDYYQYIDTIRTEVEYPYKSLFVVASTKEQPSKYFINIDFTAVDVTLWEQAIQLLRKIFINAVCSIPHDSLKERNRQYKESYDFYLPDNIYAEDEMYVMLAAATKLAFPDTYLYNDEDSDSDSSISYYVSRLVCNVFIEYRFPENSEWPLSKHQFDFIADQEMQMTSGDDVQSFDSEDCGNDCHYDNSVIIDVECQPSNLAIVIDRLNELISDGTIKLEEAKDRGGSDGSSPFIYIQQGDKTKHQESRIWLLFDAKGLISLLNLPDLESYITNDFYEECKHNNLASKDTISSKIHGKTQRRNAIICQTEDGKCWINLP